MIKLKCPMTFNCLDKKYSVAFDCIGAECAAYVTRKNDEREYDCDPTTCKTPSDEYEYLAALRGQGSKCDACEIGNQWKCAAMPQELWHDVEERK
jgi:hypothetical protein